MKKIVLCPNPYRDHGLRMTQKVREILAEEGIESVISLPFQPEGDVLPKELTYLPVKTAIKGAVRRRREHPAFGQNRCGEPFADFGH